MYEKDNLYIENCSLFTDQTKIKNPKYCQNGDILITASSQNVQEIAKACAYLGKEPALVDNICIVLKHNQNPKYLSYSLSTNYSQKQKIKLSINACQFNVNFDLIKKIKIPIPNLEKQEEIANLLDKFWKISNNVREGLPTEILLSKKQYEYYRNKLLA